MMQGFLGGLQEMDENGLEMSLKLIFGVTFGVIWVAKRGRIGGGFGVRRRCGRWERGLDAT